MELFELGFPVSDDLQDVAKGIERQFRAFVVAMAQLEGQSKVLTAGQAAEAGDLDLLKNEETIETALRLAKLGRKVDLLLAPSLKSPRTPDEESFDITLLSIGAVVKLLPLHETTNGGVVLGVFELGYQEIAAHLERSSDSAEVVNKLAKLLGATLAPWVEKNPNWMNNIQLVQRRSWLTYLAVGAVVGVSVLFILYKMRK